MTLTIIDHFNTAEREYRIVVDEQEFGHQDQLHAEMVAVFQRALADMMNVVEVRA